MFDYFRYPAFAASLVSAMVFSGITMSTSAAYAEDCKAYKGTAFKKDLVRLFEGVPVNNIDTTKRSRVVYVSGNPNNGGTTSFIYDKEDGNPGVVFHWDANGKYYGYAGVSLSRGESLSDWISSFISKPDEFNTDVRKLFECSDKKTKPKSFNRDFRDVPVPTDVLLNRLNRTAIRDILSIPQGVEKNGYVTVTDID